MVTGRHIVVMGMIFFFVVTSIGNIATSYAKSDKRNARRLEKAGIAFTAQATSLEENGQPEDAIALYERALMVFTRSYQLVPKPFVAIRIGLLLNVLGRYQESVALFLSFDPEGESARVIAIYHKAFSEAKSKLVIFRFANIKPDNAAVLIDGEEVVDRSRPILRGAGEHLIEIMAEGHEIFVESDNYPAGTDKDFVVELEKSIEEKAVAQVVVDEEVVIDTGLPSGKKYLSIHVKAAPSPPIRKLLIGLGVTTGLLVSATVTGVMAMTRSKIWEDEAIHPEDRLAARDSGKTLAKTSDFLWVATALTGIYTSLYYFNSYAPEARRLRVEHRAKKMASRSSSNPFIIAWDVLPTVTQSSAGVAVHGRF